MLDNSIISHNDSIKSNLPYTLNIYLDFYDFLWKSAVKNCFSLAKMIFA